MRYGHTRWFYRHRSLLVFFFLLFLSLLLTFFSKSYYRDGIRDLGGSLVGFFQRLAHNSSETIESVGLHLENRDQLYKECLSLKEKIQELELQLASFADIENRLYLAEKQLSDLKQIDNLNSYQPIGTKIAAFSHNGASPSFIIPKGKQDGIVKNAPVITIQNEIIALVGRVVSVSNKTSTVRPLYNSLSAIGARIENLRYEGILHGSGSIDKDMSLTHINKSAQNQIIYGDKVITSGLSSLYPAGILIGTITAFKPDINNPTLTIMVKPFVTFDALELIYVLVPLNYYHEKEENL